MGKCDYWEILGINILRINYIYPYTPSKKNQICNNILTMPAFFFNTAGWLTSLLLNHVYDKMHFFLLESCLFMPYKPCLDFMCRWTSLLLWNAVSQILHRTFLILKWTLLTWRTNVDRWLKAFEHSWHTKSFSFLWTDFIWFWRWTFCFAT